MDETDQQGGEQRRAVPIVLYTLGSLKIGGTELRSLELIGALRARHPSLLLILYVTNPESGPLEPAFRRLGIPIIHGKRNIAGIWHMRRTCIAAGVSILHTNADTLCGFHCLAGALGGVETRIAYYQCSAPPGFGLRDRIILHAGRLLLRLFATQVAGVCQGARSLSGIGPGRWLTLHSGIRVEAPPARQVTARESRAILFLGRIHPEKDYLKAVDIFDALSEASMTATLHFVGPGSTADMARLAERIERSPRRDSIVVYGPTEDVRAHLRRADVLLLPSTREGLPGAVLEALSEGVPVVATDVAGLREIQQATTGVRLVAHKAPAASWAAELRHAMADDHSEEIRGEFARSPFQFETFVGAIEDLWRIRPDRRSNAA